MKRIIVLISVLFFFACSKDDSSPTIPESFRDGDKIYFDSDKTSNGYASWVGPWFYVKGFTSNQWWHGDNPVEVSDKVSRGSYTYELIDSKTAVLYSTNYQATSGRSWTIYTNMIYETPRTGRYKSTITHNGLQQEVEGTFTIYLYEENQ